MATVCLEKQKTNQNATLNVDISNRIDASDTYVVATYYSPAPSSHIRPDKLVKKVPFHALIKETTLYRPNGNVIHQGSRYTPYL